MKQSFGKVTELDQSWIVTDEPSAAGKEVKYTVDAFGIERLRYRDGVAPALKVRDRWARRTSRAVAVLPGRWRHRLVEVGDRATQLADLLDSRLLERGSRRVSSHRPGLTLVGRASAPRRAVLVQEYDAATEAERQRSDVLDVLRAAELDPVVLPAGPGANATVALRGRDAERAADALSGQLDVTWSVIPLEADGGVRSRRVTARHLRALLAQDGGFRLFRRTAAGPGLLISGAEVGVDVEAWRDPHPEPSAEDAGSSRSPRVEADDRLVALRRQVWSDRLEVSTWEQSAASGTAELAVSRLPHLFDVSHPIDVVYTWVDDADEEWNAARIAALHSPRGITRSPAATYAARFRSHDELRYSLRSLEMFAPWVRTVHIVTAGQTPYWLNVAHPRVNLVDHREIFADPRVLPVFNSHAIESQLHRIPGLAENYLYLNDDVFFGRPVAPELFFHGNGIAKFFPSTALIGHGPREAHDDPVTSAAKNNRELIEKVFGRTTTTIFQHTPHPQLRSVLEEMEARHPEVFAQVAASRFRHPDDLSITSALHHYYAYGLGKAVPGRLAYLYMDLGHPHAARRLRRMLRSRELDVFCLNDSPAVGSDGEKSGHMLRSFLSRYFPLPSTFERTDAAFAREAVEELPQAPREALA